MKSLGFVEVSGVVDAIDALDLMLKAANVQFVTWERKFGGHLGGGDRRGECVGPAGRTRGHRQSP